MNLALFDRRGACAKPMTSSRCGGIHAYGDTGGDLPLRALAHERYYRWQPLPA